MLSSQWSKLRLQIFILFEDEEEEMAEEDEEDSNFRDDASGVVGTVDNDNEGDNQADRLNDVESRELLIEEEIRIYY